MSIDEMRSHVKEHDALQRLQEWIDGSKEKRPFADLGISYCAGNDAFAKDVVELIAAYKRALTPNV